MEIEKIKNIIEAVLLSAEKPMTVIQLEELFVTDMLGAENEKPSRDEIRQVLHILDDEYVNRGFELKQVASGFRLQVRQQYADWVGRLWEEKPARYSRALLETLALIAYRQPITRGEIEEVRGVSVSSNIIKTCLERDWIKVLGHKDVPGRPSLYGTTREFLDYFNLKTLDELPSLAEITDLDNIHPELALSDDIDSNENDEDSAEQETVVDNQLSETSEEVTDNEVNQNGIDTDVVAEDEIDTHQEESADDQHEKSEAQSDVNAEVESAEDSVEENTDDDIKENRVDTVSL